MHDGLEKSEILRIKPKIFGFVPFRITGQVPIAFLATGISQVSFRQTQKTQKWNLGNKTVQLIMQSIVDILVAML